MEALKWDYKKHSYNPYTLPEGAVLKADKDSSEVSCAACGRTIIYGNSYTSREIHTSIGIGYAVCEECHVLEIQRKTEDEEGG